MSEPKITPDGPEPRHEVTALVRAGSIDDALALADRFATELTDTHQLVGVLLAKLAALLNLNALPRSTAVVDELWSLLGNTDAEAAQLAEFHSLAAGLAHRQGAVERCVSHLVRAAHTLEAMPPSRAAMRAWLITATIYSYVGFHRQALAALGHARDMADHGSAVDRQVSLKPEIHLRHAVFLDQQGDSLSAMSALGTMVGRLRPQQVTVIQQPYLGYAIARYDLLRTSRRPAPAGADGMDGTAPPDVAGARALLQTGADAIPETGELRWLGAAVLAVVEGHPDDALDLLEDAEVTHTRLGLAELPRLRMFAHTALGDFPAALDAQCEVTAMLARGARQFYDLFIDGVTTRIEYDELMRANTRHADEARTDPLTGLPNRRHLEWYVSELLDRGRHGMIAVADVDRFKDVNTVHGHLVGDQVLRQVAAIVSRTLRDDDFLARFGGDEFVVVMPDHDLAEAEKVAARLTAAVRDHGWESIVPGNPVSVTIGLAPFDHSTSFDDAFRAADLLMLHAKKAR
jgi:diguanylate cyclase (GGDEF)-like protein